ncbi:DUF1569 domain-containing protein [Tundrisphaera sp. TA3]|uniref:DUF1569 domain-containing protein n=1 Tax=Tundrisphaera sp. TA3 TaxID=3435775 RepID=UPI003EBDB8C3
MAARRDLTFERLDDVMADVDRLLKGHTTLGRWSLGQICNHLSGSFIGSVEGYGGKAPWLIRQTFGRFMKRKILRSGRMREGAPLPAKFQPKPGLDDRAEAEALRAVIGCVTGSRPPSADHPFLGPMAPEEWMTFHRIHAAHHLSFVIPDEAC